MNTAAPILQNGLPEHAPYKGISAEEGGTNRCCWFPERPPASLLGEFRPNKARGGSSVLPIRRSAHSQVAAVATFGEHWATSSTSSQRRFLYVETHHRGHSSGV